LRRTNWLVRTSCRWRDWKTAHGRIPHGFRSEADGAGIAQRPVTKVKFRRKTFWKHSAIWATRAVAVGRRQSARGMLCDSRFPLRGNRRCEQSREVPRLLRLAFFSSVMFANEITGPPNMVIWSSIWRKLFGCGGTKMRAFRRWRNVFWSRI
jgi:hypothetical protein